MRDKSKIKSSQQRGIRSSLQEQFPKLEPHFEQVGFLLKSQSFESWTAVIECAQMEEFLCSVREHWISCAPSPARAPSAIEF